MAIDGGDGRGYVLTTDGRLTPFGGAPAQTHGGHRRRRSISSSGRNGTSGWVVDRCRPPRPASAAPRASTCDGAVARAVAADLDDDGRGYVLASERLARTVERRTDQDRGDRGAARPSTSSSGRTGPAGGSCVSDGSDPGLRRRRRPRAAPQDPARRARCCSPATNRAASCSTPTAASGRSATPTRSPRSPATWASRTAVDAGRIDRSGLPESDLGRVVIAQHEFFLRSTPVGPTFDKAGSTSPSGAAGSASAFAMAKSDEYAGLDHRRSVPTGARP